MSVLHGLTGRGVERYSEITGSQSWHAVNLHRRERKYVRRFILAAIFTVQFLQGFIIGKQDVDLAVEAYPFLYSQHKGVESATVDGEFPRRRMRRLSSAGTGRLVAACNPGRYGRACVQKN